MCQSYKEIISEENKKRKPSNMFHDALVPFAERWIIKMQKKKRIIWIDNAKGIAILAVILGHVESFFHLCMLFIW